MTKFRLAILLLTGSMSLVDTGLQISSFILYMFERKRLFPFPFQDGYHGSIYISSNTFILSKYTAKYHNAVGTEPLSALIGGIESYIRAAKESQYQHYALEVMKSSEVILP